MRARRTSALLAGLLLLSSSLFLGSVVAHSGGSSDHHEGDSGGSRVKGGAIPRTKLTPDREFVRQTNPAIDGPNAVWQEKEAGRDWEIVHYNLSKDGPAVPLTNDDADQVNPTVKGNWVAWEVPNGSTSPTTNLEVLNLETGRLFNVPDSSRDDVDPALAPNGTVYYRVKERPAQLRAFDPTTGDVYEPVGDARLAGPPAFHDGHLVWAEGKRGAAKLHIENLTTGTTHDVPNLVSLRDGPVIDEHGIGYISFKSGGQRGTYATKYNVTTGTKHLRTGVLPHENIDACPGGFVWDQHATGPSDDPVIVYHDRYLDKRQTFGAHHYDPACGFDRILYEQRVDVEGSEGTTRHMYMIRLENARLPSEPTVRPETGFENSILRSPIVVEGIAKTNDPRVGLKKVLGAVDGENGRVLTSNGTGQELEWRMRIDPRRYESGEHELIVVVQDEANRTTRHQFKFFTNTPYELDQGVFDEGVDVPREQKPGFPLNLLDHYQTYQQFYNTLLLALALLIVGIWFGLRWWQREEPKTPEYVRPNDP